MFEPVRGLLYLRDEKQQICFDVRVNGDLMESADKRDAAKPVRVICLGELRSSYKNDVFFLVLSAVCTIAAIFIGGVAYRHFAGIGTVTSVAEIHHLHSPEARDAGRVVLNVGGTLCHQRGRVIGVDLQGTRANDSTMAEIEPLKQTLETLSLGSLGLTVQSAVSLQSFSNLRRLSLIDCAEVDDAWIPYLSKLRSLEYLNIRGTNISPEGKKSLRRALVPNRTIQIEP